MAEAMDETPVQRVRTLVTGLTAFSDPTRRQFTSIAANQISEIFGSGLRKTICMYSSFASVPDTCKDCGFDQKTYFPCCPVCGKRLGCEEVRTVSSGLPPRGNALVGHPIYVLFDNDHWYGGVVSEWWQPDDLYIVSFLDDTSASLKLFDQADRLWRLSRSIDISLPNFSVRGTHLRPTAYRHARHYARLFDAANKACGQFRLSRMALLSSLSLPFAPPILRIVVDFLAWRPRWMI